MPNCTQAGPAIWRPSSRPKAARRETSRRPQSAASFAPAPIRYACLPAQNGRLLIDTTAMVMDNTRRDGAATVVRRSSSGRPATRPIASRMTRGGAMPAAVHPPIHKRRHCSKCGNRPARLRPHAGQAATCHPFRCVVGQASAQVRIMATACRGAAFLSPARASPASRSRRLGGMSIHRRSRGTQAAAAVTRRRRSCSPVRAGPRPSRRRGSAGSPRAARWASASNNASNIVSAIAGADQNSASKCASGLPSAVKGACSARAARSCSFAVRNSRSCRAAPILPAASTSRPKGGGTRRPTSRNACTEFFGSERCGKCNVRSTTVPYNAAICRVGGAICATYVSTGAMCEAK